MNSVDLIKGLFKLIDIKEVEDYHGFIKNKIVILKNFELSEPELNCVVPQMERTNKILFLDDVLYDLSRWPTYKLNLKYIDLICKLGGSIEDIYNFNRLINSEIETLDLSHLHPTFKFIRCGNLLAIYIDYLREVYEIKHKDNFLVNIQEYELDRMLSTIEFSRMFDCSFVLVVNKD